MISLVWCLLLVVSVGAVPMPFYSDLVEDYTIKDTCSCGWTNKGRIVGGQETGKNEYPMMVSLQNRGFPFCGGSIVTPYHVLTAAHCTVKKTPRDISIVVGAHYTNSNGEGVYDVAKIYVHEQYDDRLIQNDISLLVTKDKMKFSQNVGPVCFPANRLSIVGQTIKAVGWGQTSDQGYASPSLRHVDLRVVSIASCSKVWKAAPSSIKEDPEAIPIGSNLCTYATRQDTCAGDSGGPLLWLDPKSNRYTIAALVSYGGICGGELPAVNTDVSAFVGWVNGKIVASGKGVTACRKG